MSRLTRSWPSELEVDVVDSMLSERMWRGVVVCGEETVVVVSVAESVVEMESWERAWVVVGRVGGVAGIVSWSRGGVNVSLWVCGRGRWGHVDWWYGKEGEVFGQWWRDVVAYKVGVQGVVF